MCPPTASVHALQSSGPGDGHDTDLLPQQSSQRWARREKHVLAAGGITSLYLLPAARAAL